MSKEIKFEKGKHHFKEKSTSDQRTPMRKLKIILIISVILLIVGIILSALGVFIAGSILSTIGSIGITIIVLYLLYLLLKGDIKISRKPKETKKLGNVQVQQIESIFYPLIVLLIGGSLFVVGLIISLIGFPIGTVIAVIGVIILTCLTLYLYYAIYKTSKRYKKHTKTQSLANLEVKKIKRQIFGIPIDVITVILGLIVGIIVVVVVIINVFL